MSIRWSLELEEVHPLRRRNEMEQGIMYFVH